MIRTFASSHAMKVKESDFLTYKFFRNLYDYYLNQYAGDKELDDVYKKLIYNGSLDLSSPLNEIMRSCLAWSIKGNREIIDLTNEETVRNPAFLLSLANGDTENKLKELFQRFVEHSCYSLCNHIEKRHWGPPKVNLTKELNDQIDAHIYSAGINVVSVLIDVGTFGVGSIVTGGWKEGLKSAFKNSLKPSNLQKGVAKDLGFMVADSYPNMYDNYHGTNTSDAYADTDYFGQGIKSKVAGVTPYISTGKSAFNFGYNVIMIKRKWLLKKSEEERQKFLNDEFETKSKIFINNITKEIKYYLNSPYWYTNLLLCFSNVWEGLLKMYPDSSRLRNVSGSSFGELIPRKMYHFNVDTYVEAHKLYVHWIKNNVKPLGYWVNSILEKRKLQSHKLQSHKIPDARQPYIPSYYPMGDSMGGHHGAGNF